MTDEQLSKEFKRWLNADRPEVWVRHKEEKEWEKMKLPCWNSRELYYIVDDDKYAELRKHLVDNPDTKIQCKVNSNSKWADIINPQFDIPNCEYRVKPKPKPKIERRWRYAKDEEGCTLTTSNYVADSLAEEYGYCGDGWYKLENDYIDVKVEEDDR